MIYPAGNKPPADQTGQVIQNERKEDKEEETNTKPK